RISWSPPWTPALPARSAPPDGRRRCGAGIGARIASTSRASGVAFPGTACPGPRCPGTCRSCSVPLVEAFERPGRVGSVPILEGTRSQTAQRNTTRSRPREPPGQSMKKNFVLDTNVLLHDPRSLFSFDDNNVVIPIYVIEEVDKFKRDQSELGRNS